MTFECGGEIVGDATRMSVTWKELASALEPNEILYLADGSIRLRVKRDAACRVPSSTPRSRSAASSPHARGSTFPVRQSGCRPCRRRTSTLLRHGESIGVDLVALSFVRTAREIEFVRERTRLPLIAKIEKPQAVENMYEILRAADCVMVARGDLGIELPIEQVPLVQKQL